MSKEKREQNENVENVNETANVENTQADAGEETQTVEQIKAARVLRAKLPHLSELNFNFEKRTGNVFTATIVKVFDEDGQPVIEDGVQKEKLTRKVVEIENEQGDLLPKYAAIKDELAAKRAAAFVLNADSLKEKLEQKKADLVAQMEEVDEALATHDVSLSTACEIVMAVDIPEAAPRANMTAKLAEASDKLEKMKALLLAAGLTEDMINEQLGM